MIFQVVFPYNETIYGDTFKEAIKNFVKLKHDLNIREIIIKDQTKQMRANLRYYNQNGVDKVGINMFPVGLDYPIPVVINDGYTTPRMLDIGNTLLPLSPIPGSPLISIPFIPTVVKIPNL
jgi:hypothetical protein